jgi:transcriptional regulator with XRE-family HTH domain
VETWSGREARALREALRLSVRDFAAYLGVAPRTVSKWESGGSAVHPRPDLQRVLDTALQRADDAARVRFDAGLARTAPGGETDPRRPDTGWGRDAVGELASFLADGGRPTAGSALRLAREWRTTDAPQVVQMRAGRRVGDRLARLVGERVAVLRRMDDVLGGGDLHDLVRTELRSTLDAMREATYTAETGRVLLSAVADLCQLAGWVAADAGLCRRAERYYLGGVSAAHAARDAPLAANLLSSLAYQLANVGDPREAVLLAVSAHRAAERHAAPLGRVLLLERVAWANARLGDVRATERALGAAGEEFAGTEPADGPPWAYWLTGDEVDVMAARCLTELRRPRPAIELLTPVVARYDATHARELALYLSWLAEAHVYAGEVDQAAAVAARVVELSAGVASARSRERVQLLRRLLLPHRGNAAVHAFEERARATSARRSGR